MGAEVIKEFLVSLGYKVEAGQERKFKDAVGSATTAVVGLGVAAAATASAVTAAVVKIGRSFDNLYWQAQRTQTTVAQIKAMSYAASQLGGSADEASASIEAFGKNLKWNVGFEGFLKQLGVVTRSNGQLRDSVALLRDFAGVLKGRSKTEQMGLAQVAGIDLRTLEAIQRGDFQRHLDEYAAKVRALGVDEDKASEKGKALQQSMRSLEATLAAIGTLLLDKFGPALAESFDKIEEFVRNNGDKFIAAFEKLAKVAGELAEIFGKIVDVLGPIWEGFDKLTQSLTGYDGLTVALTALIALKVAPWLTGIAAAILSVGTAANTALLGGALAKFFGLLGVAAPVGAFALGMSPTDGNAGENEAIARRRAAGTFGPASPADLDADAARRQKARQQDNSLWGRVKRWWNGGDTPSKAASTAPISGSSFREKAPGVMRRLMEDFGLTKEQAAGVVGNLGHESSGFTEMQEKNPMVPGSRGGYGWAQWTGPRRRAFEAWAAEKGLDPSSDEANYGFLKRELETTHKNVIGSVKGTQSSSEAMQVFEDGYEKSGIKNYGSRQRWTDRALSAFDAAPAAAGASQPPQPRSGFKVNNNLGENERGNLASNSLFSNQRFAEQQMDSRLTKTAQGGSSLFDPSSILAKAADNAASVGGAGLGGNGAALTPPPGSTAGTTVTVNQENHVSVTGSGDPHDTAQQIGNTQRDVNAGMVRDLKGAVR